MAETNEVKVGCSEEGSVSKLLTIGELADLLQVPKSWLYDRSRMSESNGFPVIRVGKYLRFSFEKVLDYLKNQ